MRGQGKAFSRADEKPLFMHITCSCYNRLEEMAVHVIQRGEKGGQEKELQQRENLWQTVFQQAATFDRGAHEANACYHSLPTTVTFYKSAHCRSSKATCTHTRKHTHTKLAYSRAHKYVHQRALVLCHFVVAVAVVLCSPELIPLMENCTSMLRKKLQQQQPQENRRRKKE